MSLIGRAISTAPTTLIQTVLQSRLSPIVAGLYFRADPLIMDSFPTPVGDVDVFVPPEATFRKHTDPTDMYEPRLVRELGEALESESVFFDVGGNYGFMSAVAIRCGCKPANVESFEPNPFTLRILKRNATTHGFSAIQARVGTGEHSLALDDHDRVPDVVKIDVEGAEMAVLRGMHDVIRERKPTLFIEVHRDRIESFDTAEADILNFLSDFGYELAVIQHREDIKPTANEFEDVSVTNYLLKAVPE